MRLKGAEMGIYGLLPETDRFAVVICEICEAVVKPQGLQNHVSRHQLDSSTSSALTPCTVNVSQLNVSQKFDMTSIKSENSNSSSMFTLLATNPEATQASSAMEGTNPLTSSFTADNFELELIKTEQAGPIILPTKSAGKSVSRSSGQPSLKVKISKSGKPGRDRHKSTFVTSSEAAGELARFSPENNSENGKMIDLLGWFISLVRYY